MSAFHPLRWLTLLLAVLPVILFVLWFAAWTMHHSAARSAFRWFRNVFATELILVALLAVVGLVYENVSAARARRQYPPPGKLIDVGRYKLHLDCAGQGSPTVILIYGMSGSYLDWYWVQPEIAKFARVCSFDRPGYGWSDLNAKTPLPSAEAEDLRVLLEKAGEKPPFVLVGHSLGAFDVLMYAHRFRDQVAGAVLVDGASPDWTSGFSGRDRMALRLLQLTAPFGVPRWRKWCLQGPPPIAERKSAFNCQARVYKANYKLWDSYPQAAQEIRALGPVGALPLTVISRDPNRDGRANSAGELRWASLQESLARLSTKTTHVIAHGSGHGVPLERPDVVVEQVRRMVEQVRSQGR